ncbi:MAG: hypothetical protein ACRD5L_04595 [Bryobacteraceae bacterium]
MILKTGQIQRMMAGRYASRERIAFPEGMVAHTVWAVEIRLAKIQRGVIWLSVFTSGADAALAITAGRGRLSPQNWRG